MSPVREVLQIDRQVMLLHTDHRLFLTHSTLRRQSHDVVYLNVRYKADC